MVLATETVVLAGSPPKKEPTWGNDNEQQGGVGDSNNTFGGQTDWGNND